MFTKKLALAIAITLASTTGFAKNKMTMVNSLFALQFPKETPTSQTDLLYFGGPVISNVKVFVGIWNDRVSAPVKNGIANFYAAYVASPQMDWLNEYQTGVKAVDGRDGTAQTIGRGQMIGQKLMTPFNTAKRITDAQIQEEIVKQIDAGNFPRPDKDTLYMLHFSKDMSISIDGQSSCLAFGGYHEGFHSDKYGDIFYGVLPECAGFGATNFDSITFVSSHELNEAVTDAFPTPADKPAYPQAWNDVGGNEIADICQNNRGTSLQTPNATYSIALEWSNSRHSCYDGK
ncbi:MAG: hypothetical protein ACXVAX_04175 [Pseudobdellovibrio sp.]